METMRSTRTSPSPPCIVPNLCVLTPPQKKGSGTVKLNESFGSGQDFHTRRRNHVVTLTFTMNPFPPKYSSFTYITCWEILNMRNWRRRDGPINDHFSLFVKTSQGGKEVKESVELKELGGRKEEMEKGRDDRESMLLFLPYTKLLCIDFLWDRDPSHIVWIHQILENMKCHNLRERSLEKVFCFLPNNKIPRVRLMKNIKYHSDYFFIFKESWFGFWFLVQITFLAGVGGEGGEENQF